MIKKDMQFKLDNFEGPLDLLLHMIRSKQLDLLELSLVKVADQYIEFINKADKLNLDEASEYLLIASQLVEMKSKHLMKTEIFQEPSEYEEDTENLIDRLVEYERYKKASSEIENLYEKASRYEKIEDDFIGFIEEDGERVIKLVSKETDDLIKAMKNMMIRLENKKPLETKLQFKRISAEQRREQVEKELETNGDTTFISLIGENVNHYFIAITLLVLLEMANAGIITIIQNESYDDIEIRRLSK